MAQQDEPRAQRCGVSKPLLLTALFLLSGSLVRASQPNPDYLETRVLALRQVLQQNPSNLQAHLELAVSLQQLNHLKPDGGRRIPEAEASYRAILTQLAPGEAQIQVAANLAALLLEAERPQDGLQLLDEALSAVETLRSPPPLGLIHGMRFNRAKALAALGRLADAQDAYVATAVAAHGADISSYAKAVAAMEQMPGSMVQQVRAVVAAARQRMVVAAAVAAHAGSTGSRQQQKGGLHVPPDASGSDGPWLDQATLQEVSWLGFALYKALDRHGDADSAWEELVRANEAMAAQLPPYDATHDWRQLATLKAVFTADMLAAASSDNGDGGSGLLVGNAPIFVVGLPRSGSTLVEQILASHPGIPNTHSTASSKDSYGGGDGDGGSGGSDAGRRVISMWAAGEDTALAPLTGEINRRLAEIMLTAQQGGQQGSGDGSGVADGREIAALMKEYGLRYMSEMRKRFAKAHKLPSPPDADSRSNGGDTALAHAKWPVRIVDKMLRNLWLVGYIHMMLPHTCIVHVVRHPLDAGLSCYAQPFGYSGVPWSWRLADIAEQIKMTYDLAAHWDAVLPGRVLTLYYEELILRPEPTARRLLEHCGLPWSDAVLSFHKLNRTVATASVAQVRKPLYRSSVSRWRRYEQHLQPLADTLGHLPIRYEQLLEQAIGSDPGQEASMGKISGEREAERTGVVAGETGSDETAGAVPASREQDGDKRGRKQQHAPRHADESDAAGSGTPRDEL